MNIDDVIAGLSGNMEGAKFPEVKPARTRKQYVNPNRELLKNAGEVSTELLNGIYDSVSSSAEDISDIAILLSGANEYTRDFRKTTTDHLIAIDKNVGFIWEMMKLSVKEDLRTDLGELEDKNEAERTAKSVPVITEGKNKLMDGAESMMGSAGLGLGVAGLAYGAYKLAEPYLNEYVTNFLEGWEVVKEAFVDGWSYVKELGSDVWNWWTENLEPFQKIANDLGDTSLKVAEMLGINVGKDSFLAKTTDSVLGLDKLENAAYTGGGNAAASTLLNYRERQENINKNLKLTPGMTGYIDPMTLPTHAEYIKTIPVGTRQDLAKISDGKGGFVIPTTTRNTDVNSQQMDYVNRENKESGSTVTVVTGNDMSTNTNVASTNGGGMMAPSVPMRDARNASPVIRYMEFGTYPIL